MKKRSAFRFNGFRMPVQYKTAYDEGTAYLSNISTSGCALESLTTPISVSETFLLSIALEEEQDHIEVRALAVRPTKEGIAAKFTIIEQTSQTKLRIYFCKKLRNHS